MIKQNIKLAILAIFAFFGLWAIVCAFIKVDVCSKTLINQVEDTPLISIKKDDAMYIEKHNISYLKIEYEKQYFNCSITFESQQDQYTNYFIFLPSVIPKTETLIITNVIIDTLNVYQYLFKK